MKPELFSHGVDLGLEVDRADGVSAGVAVDDLELDRVLHAFAESVLACLDDAVAELRAKAGQEELVAKVFLSIFDTFGLDLRAVGGGGGGSNGSPDIGHGGGLGVDHPSEGLTDSQVVVMSAFAHTLH